MAEVLVLVQVELPELAGATVMRVSTRSMAITASRRIVTTAVAVLGAYLTIVRITTSSGHRHRKELVPSRCPAQTGCANDKSLPRHFRSGAGKWSPAPAASASRSASTQPRPPPPPDATVPGESRSSSSSSKRIILTEWPPVISSSNIHSTILTRCWSEAIPDRPASATVLPRRTPIRRRSQAVVASPPLAAVRLPSIPSASRDASIYSLSDASASPSCGHSSTTATSPRSRSSSTPARTRPSAVCWATLPKRWASPAERPFRVARASDRHRHCEDVQTSLRKTHFY